MGTHAQRTELYCYAIYEIERFTWMRLADNINCK